MSKTAAERAQVRWSAAQRQAAIEEIKLHDEQQRRASQGQLEAFLYRYLPSAFYALPGAFHRAIYADLEGLVKQTLTVKHEDEEEVIPYDAAAYAYPRGHGKTTTITLGFLLWVIAEWRSMPHFNGDPPFILIVSDTRDQARDRSLDLRDELEGNMLLQQDYGNFVPSRRSKRSTKWTETDWTTEDGVRVKAVGSGSKVRGLLRKGRRPTLIIMDDLENDEAVSTQKRRQKLEKWVQKALLPTGLEGKLLTICVGTILHADSFLSRLLSPDHFPGWLKRRYAAQYNEAGLPDPNGEVILWPQGWPLSKLKARKRKIGSVAYAQEYLNQPVDDETSLFQRAWLDAAKRRGAGLPFLYAPTTRIPFSKVVSTWDPAELAATTNAGAYQVLVTAWDLSVVDDEKKAQLKDSDYTVGITVGLDATDKMHVRRIYRKRGLTPAALRARVVSEQRVVRADYIAIENNAAQKIHEIELRGIPGMPIVGHTTDKKKHSVFEGVPSLAMQLELGRMDFCASSPREQERIDRLINELHGLGMEAHDDMVMALWIATVTIRKWMRKRDKARLRLLGPPPAGYIEAFPMRERQKEAA